MTDRADERCRRRRQGRRVLDDSVIDGDATEKTCMRARARSWERETGAQRERPARVVGRALPTLRRRPRRRRRDFAPLKWVREDTASACASRVSRATRLFRPAEEKAHEGFTSETRGLPSPIPSLCRSVVMGAAIRRTNIGLDQHALAHPSGRSARRHQGAASRATSLGYRVCRRVPSRGGVVSRRARPGESVTLALVRGMRSPVTLATPPRAGLRGCEADQPLVG